MGENLDERRFDFEREKALKEEEREAKKTEQEHAVRNWLVVVLLVPLLAAWLDISFNLQLQGNDAKVRFIQDVASGCLRERAKWWEIHLLVPTERALKSSFARFELHRCR